MKRGLNLLFIAVFGLGMMGAAFAGSADLSSGNVRLEQRLSGQVHHALAMIPQFTIFDNLGYRVEGGNVTLYGQVRDAIVKDEAESSVKHLEGVERVNNQIEVLPASFNDDLIRREVARALFNDPRLSSYAIEPVPSIHIIVKNGRVNLEGVVRTETEKNSA
ncbi:MAG: BON domain-containing protein, partial [Candidatus Angelobacter sp.]